MTDSAEKERALVVKWLMLSAERASDTVEWGVLQSVAVEIEAGFHHTQPQPEAE